MPLLRRLPLFLFAVCCLPVGAADDLHGDPMPPGALVRLGTTRLRHNGYPFGTIQFTPDGQALIAGGEGYVLTVCDARTGKHVREISLGNFYSRSFALSPDGKVAALGGNTYEKDGKGEVEGIRFIEVATGKVLRTFKRTGRYDSTVAFNSDGKYIASNVDGSVVIEEVATGTALIKERFPERAGGLTFTGGLLAATSRSSVWLWDWQSGKPPREVKVPAREASSVSLGPGGTVLATGDERGGTIRLWDLASGKQLKAIRAGEREYYIRVVFSPDGRMLASTSHRSLDATLWDVATGKEIRRIPIGHRHHSGVFWSPDSSRLAVRLSGGVRIFDAKTGKEAVTLPEGHWNTPSVVALLADGTAMTASDDGTVRLWNAATGKHRSTINASEEWVRGAAISPDGRWIATSTQKPNAVTLWDVKTGRPVYRLPGHGSLGGRRLMAFTPDGKRFLSWGDDLFLRGWEVRNGKAFIEHEPRPEGETAPDPDTAEDDIEVRYMQLGAGAFTRDAGRFVMARHDGTFVFDTATGKQVLKIKNEQGLPRSVAVSPDGKQLLVSAWGLPRRIPLPDGRVRNDTDDAVVTLHDLTTGKLLRTQKLTLPSPGTVAFSADGKLFAVDSWDQKHHITFHDTATGTLQGEITGLPGIARAIAFSPDGKRVLVGCGDTTALIYPVPTKERGR